MINITNLKKALRDKYKHMSLEAIEAEDRILFHEAMWIGLEREIANERKSRLRNLPQTELCEEHKRYTDAVCYGAKV